MQCAAACALVKTLHEKPARLKGVEALNDPRHLSCSVHQQQNPLIYTKWKGKSGYQAWPLEIPCFPVSRHPGDIYLGSVTQFISDW